MKDSRTTQLRFDPHRNLIDVRSVALISLLLVVAAAGVTCWIWMRGVTWMRPASSGPSVVLVKLDYTTLSLMQRGGLGIDIAGLDSTSRKSWRLLHGALLRKLACAHPRCVVFDYYFPDAQPLYDDAFARDIRAAGAPVVIGVEQLRSDGTPDITESLSTAVAGYGLVTGLHPEWRLILGAMSSGSREPIPSLAVAAYAHSMHPGCSFAFSFGDAVLQLRYRSTLFPREWSYTENLPITKLEEGTTTLSGIVQRAAFLGMPVSSRGPKEVSIVPYHQVFTSTEKELGAQLQDRVVVVGETLPGAGEITRADGAVGYGAEVQAQWINALLSRTAVIRPAPLEILWRVSLCALLVGLVLAMVPQARIRCDDHWPICLGLICAGVSLSIVHRPTVPLSSLGAELLIYGSSIPVMCGVACIAWTVVIRLRGGTGPAGSSPRPTESGECMRETRPSETVVRSSTRPTVFICYAHADNESQDRKLLWLDRFRTFLAPCVRQDHVTVWSDREIQAGENWHETIQARLAAADAAVLLVSPYLLASEYFANSELPVLLKGASDRGLRIISILLAPCGFDRAKFKYPDPRTGPNEFTLSSLQAANAPSETLLDLSEAEQNRVFTRVAGQLADLVPQTDGNRVRQPIS